MAIVIGRRGSVQVTECADTHLLEGEVEVCVGGHGCLVGDILCGGMAGDVQWAVSRRGRDTSREGGTHLDGATVPGKDGSLALCAEEIRFTLCELCTKDLCMAPYELYTSH